MRIFLNFALRCPRLRHHEACNIMTGTVRNMKNKILIRQYISPCGELVLGSYGDRLCLCNWTIEKHPGRVDMRLRSLLDAEYEEGKSDITDEASAQLDQYFSQERKEFDIPLLFVGTDFQKRVWQQLLAIPYGQTVSYGEMAAALGMPKAARAVANANGANAISIFAPCHRVTGSDRSLTGYGGGIAAKRFLLGIENTRYRSAGFMAPVPDSGFRFPETVTASGEDKAGAIR